MRNAWGYIYGTRIASAFLPALQILEVSLRNAIYHAKIQYEEDEIERNYPRDQWSGIKNAIDRKCSSLL